MTYAIRQSVQLRLQVQAAVGILRNVLAIATRSAQGVAFEVNRLRVGAFEDLARSGVVQVVLNAQAAAGGRGDAQTRSTSSASCGGLGANGSGCIVGQLGFNLGGGHVQNSARSQIGQLAPAAQLAILVNDLRPDISRGGIAVVDQADDRSVAAGFLGGGIVTNVDLQAATQGVQVAVTHVVLFVQVGARSSFVYAANGRERRGGHGGGGRNIVADVNRAGTRSTEGGSNLSGRNVDGDRAGSVGCGNQHRRASDGSATVCSRGEIQGAALHEALGGRNGDADMFHFNLTGVGHGGCNTAQTGAGVQQILVGQIAVIAVGILCQGQRAQHHRVGVNIRGTGAIRGKGLVAARRQDGIVGGRCEVHLDVGREIDDACVVGGSGAGVFVSNTVGAIHGHGGRIRQQLEVLEIDRQVLVVSALTGRGEVVDQIAHDRVQLADLCLGGCERLIHGNDRLIEQRVGPTTCRSDRDADGGPEDGRVGRVNAFGENVEVRSADARNAGVGTGGRGDGEGIIGRQRSPLAGGQLELHLEFLHLCGCVDVAGEAVGDRRCINGLRVIGDHFTGDVGGRSRDLTSLGDSGGSDTGDSTQDQAGKESLFHR